MARIKGRIIPATQKHIDALKGNLRESDKREIWDAARMEPDEGLQHAFDISKLCWAGVSEGQTILCFGVSAFSLLSTKGSPWILAAEDIKNVNREFIRNCKLCVKTMLSFFDRLENMVDIRNEVSIRWLKWCGFSIGDKFRYGPNNLLFYKFSMDKEE